MIFQIENLSFAYRAGGPLVLDQANISLAEGGLLSILGRNGAGKSTLFGCMLGLLKPQQGRVLLCGQEVTGMSPRRVASLVGFVPQNHAPTFAYSVYQFVLMGCASRVGLFSHPGAAERAAAEAAITQLGIEHLAERAYTELSGGERQQVTIARAIAAQPQAILFDEPTAHLDFSNQIKVLRVIRDLSQAGYAVVITSHDPNHALLLGGQAAVFDRWGHIHSGPVSQLVTEAELRDIYGSDLRIRYMEEFQRDVCLYPQL